MTLRALGDRANWDRIDGKPVEVVIDDCWEEVAEYQEQGLINETQHLHLLDYEAQMGESPIARYLTAMYLRRSLKQPTKIGINVRLEDPRNRPACGRCRDDHVVEEPDRGGGMAPCPECQPRARMLWATGHYHPDHRGCAECRPAARQRGAGASHEGEAAEDRAARVMESLR